MKTMNRLYRPQLREALQDEIGQTQLEDIDPSYRTMNEIDEDGNEFDENEDEVICSYCLGEAVDIIIEERRGEFGELSRDDLREEIPQTLDGMHEEYV